MKKIFLMFSLLSCLLFANYSSATEGMMMQDYGNQGCCDTGCQQPQQYAPQYSYAPSCCQQAPCDKPCGDCYCLYCHYRPCYYSTCHCNYIPQYQYHQCCRYIPQYYYTCSCHYCPQYCYQQHCRYVPEYYYKHECNQANTCAPCCQQ